MAAWKALCPICAACWAACSLFYGWLTPAFVPLLAVSIAFNYTIARLLDVTRPRPALQTAVLRFGVTANLAALIYYKYLAWLLGLANAAF